MRNLQADVPDRFFGGRLHIVAAEDGDGGGGTDCFSCARMPLWGSVRMRQYAHQPVVDGSQIDRAGVDDVCC
jgi:hypothetical protein